MKSHAKNKARSQNKQTTSWYNKGDTTFVAGNKRDRATSNNYRVHVHGNYKFQFRKLEILYFILVTHSDEAGFLRALF